MDEKIEAGQTSLHGTSFNFSTSGEALTRMLELRTQLGDSLHLCTRESTLTKILDLGRIRRL
jgi:hypothetical protein